MHRSTFSGRGGVSSAVVWVAPALAPCEWALELGDLRSWKEAGTELPDNCAARHPDQAIRGARPSVLLRLYICVICSAVQRCRPYLALSRDCGPAQVGLDRTKSPHSTASVTNKGKIPIILVLVQTDGEVRTSPLHVYSWCGTFTGGCSCAEPGESLRYLPSDKPPTAPAGNDSWNARTGARLRNRLISRMSLERE